MPTATTRAAVAALLIFALAPATAAKTSAEAPLIAAVNAARKAAGLGALETEPRLVCAARIHARDLAASGRFAHTGSDGGDLISRLARVRYPYAMAAENLALAGPEAAEIVALWRASPGHARNMMAAEARAAGWGRQPTKDGRFVWVLVVGAERTGNGGNPGKSIKCAALGG